MQKPQLVLLHFAGGNCYSFQFLKPRLGDFELLIPELPGRGRRMGEPLLRNFNMAADDLFNQVVDRLRPSGFLMYGHSMGAYLALRLANLLQRNGQQPAALVVSGNAGPGIQYDREHKKRYSLPHTSFIDELRALGGVPPELLEDQEMFHFFEPVLRADFEIAEENGLVNEPAVNCQLYVLMGDEEKKVKEIDNWSRFTKDRFRSTILSGDHFFIHRHPDILAGILQSCWADQTAGPHQPVLGLLT